jgi:hypothetical protein
MRRIITFECSNNQGLSLLQTTFIILSDIILSICVCKKLYWIILAVDVIDKKLIRYTEFLVHEKENGFVIGQYMNYL